MSRLLYDDRAKPINNKPKLSLQKVLDKFCLAWNLKLTDPINVFYKNSKRQPTSNDTPFFTIDFEKGDWYIGFVDDNFKAKYAVIDDLTGRIDISQR